MNNKVRIFIKVIYYVSTFALGIFLAVYLPNYFMYEMTMDTIISSLNSEQKDKAISLMGGYYCVDQYYQQDFVVEGVQCGIVLFEAETLTYKDEKDNQVENGRMHDSYAGFIYNVKAVYKTYQLKDNQAKLIVTNSEGKESTIEIIDFDSTMDGVKNCVSTIEQRNFLYIDLAIDYGTTLTSLKLIDAEGLLFREFKFDNLDFSGQIFKDVKTFANEYNSDYKSPNLKTLNDEFLAKGNGKYKVSTYGDFQTKALQRSLLIVVFYFIGIYIIADLALGKRYIIKFFKWILVKVFKVKFKEKKPKEPDIKYYAKDYFCKLTVKIDVGKYTDFIGPVVIKYSNENANLEFNLMRGFEFSSTKRVRVGTYCNLWIDIDRNYQIEDAPENLVVEGYNKELVLKLKKIERNDGKNENYNSKLD